MPVDEEFVWSDSTCVLYCIKNTSLRLKPITARRIDNIHRATEPDQWFHVPTDMNHDDSYEAQMISTSCFTDLNSCVRALMTEGLQVIRRIMKSNRSSCSGQKRIDVIWSLNGGWWWRLQRWVCCWYGKKQTPTWLLPPRRQIRLYIIYPVFTGYSEPWLGLESL